MNALIDLSLRSVFLALAHPFTRGLVFVLVALYGAGSGWPGWLSRICGMLGRSPVSSVAGQAPGLRSRRGRRERRPRFLPS